MIERIRAVLMRSPLLVDRGVIDAEAETIVLCALERFNPSVRLSRIDIYTLGARIESHPEWINQSTALALDWAERRIKGELLQHITGRQVFLDHEYVVNAHVLVPRPETEILVQEVLAWLRLKPHARGMEIGLGSGAISLELLTHNSNLAEMVSSEISGDAIEVARINAVNILPQDELKRLKIVVPDHSQDVFGAFHGPYAAKGGFDFLVSNPPYLMPGDPMDKEVAEWEPALALFPRAMLDDGQVDANYFYREIALSARRFLVEDGAVFLELPCFRVEEIEELFIERGWDTKITRDLGGLERILIAQARSL